MGMFLHRKDKAPTGAVGNSENESITVTIAAHLYLLITHAFMSIPIIIHTHNESCYIREHFMLNTCKEECKVS